MESLSARVVRGSLWVAALSATTSLVGAVRVLVLARLLTPHDFGLMGIGLVLIDLYESFSGLGIQLALIQRGGQARGLYDTAWTLGLIRGGIGSVVQLTLASTIAAFFRAPDARPIVAALALLPIIRALTNIGIVELRRELRWRPSYLIATSAVLADIAVAVPLALSMRSAWALVGGLLAAETVRVLLSYRVHPYRPTLHLARAEARELLVYGRWVFGAGVLTTVLEKGVRALIGRVLGIETLGLFSVAARLAWLPGVQVTRIVRTVTVAAYAKVQESPERLRGAYLRTLRVTALAAIPIGLGMVGYSADLAQLILGPRWGGAVPLLRVLSLLGLVRAIGGTTDPLFFGSGRPWLNTRTQGVELLVVAVIIGPFIAVAGAVGAAWAVALGSLGAESLALYLAARFLRISGRQVLPILAWPLLACLPGAALRIWHPDQFGPLSLTAVFALSGLLYVVTIILLDRVHLYPLGPLIDALPWHRVVRFLRGATAQRGTPLR